MCGELAAPSDSQLSALFLRGKNVPGVQGGLLSALKGPVYLGATWVQDLWGHHGALHFLLHGVLLSQWVLRNYPHFPHRALLPQLQPYGPTRVQAVRGWLLPGLKPLPPCITVLCGLQLVQRGLRVLSAIVCAVGGQLPAARGGSSASPLLRGV